MIYNDHMLNLIDTPGHVDFSYEVSRSLTACEGALLLVDANQGIQAQTLSTTRKAQELGLTIIPILNKIDLPNVDIAQRKHELTSMMGFKAEEIILASAKTGEGAEEILKAIIQRIPPPSGDPNSELQALIFDSFYNEHKGVVTSIRVFNGTISEKTSWPNLRAFWRASGSDVLRLCMVIFRHLEGVFMFSKILSIGSVSPSIRRLISPNTISLQSRRMTSMSGHP